MPNDPVKDPGRGNPGGSGEPAYNIVPVTKSNTVDLPVYAYALRISNTADEPKSIAITPCGKVSDASVVVPVPPGISDLLVRTRRVWVTGTDAEVTCLAYTQAASA